VLKIPAFGNTRTVTAKCKNDTADNLQLKKIKENAHAQNSTFANRTNRHTTNVCKRAVFFPTHPSPPTTLENSLTKNLEK